MKKSFNLLIILLLPAAIKVNAQQVDASADLRMRYEYRHGYSSLFSDSLKAGNFVSQRSRINLDYGGPHLKVHLAPQNVRVWGDVATNAKNDLNNAWHEAWAEVIINNVFSIKAGRQELDYDDSRVLGNLDWVMQGRSHDAAVLKISPDSMNTIHAGFALNANQESNAAQDYTVPGQYKDMQYVWYHGKFRSSGLSFLFMNQGIPFQETTKQKLAWNQTFGLRYTYKKGGLSADAAAYMQTGKIAANDLSAYYCSANLNYRFASGWVPGAGFELLSGKAGNDAGSTVKNFIPWYGTNHKFNGYMDYFYVSNLNNPTGLTDIYLNLGYEHNKWKAKLTPHYFATAAALYKNNEKMSSYLGTEVDLTVSYQLYDFVALTGGYSQMFATSSMDALKGGSSSVCNNWAFVSVQINPKLFSFKTAAAK